MIGGKQSNRTLRLILELPADFCIVFCEKFNANRKKIWIPVPRRTKGTQKQTANFSQFA